MQDNLQISLLYDFYGPLLGDNMQQAVELYYNDDLSLSEVSDIMGISRQGVRDTLSRAVKKLEDFESKLSLLSRFENEQKILEKIITDADSVFSLTDEKDIKALAENIKESASSLYEQEL